MRHKPNPNLDDVELAAVRKRLTTAGLGLWQEAEASAGLAMDGETRHETAIASVEASATPNETALVERIQAMLRTRFRFTPDDVAAYLTEAGIVRSGPQAGNIRRRLASRIINPGKGKWWTKVDEVMTKDTIRSGRRVSVWQVVQFPAQAIDTPTERG